MIVIERTNKMRHKMRHTMHIFETDIDDFQGRMYVTIAIYYEVSPGEPMVMYTRNGDGYPGSPPGAEICEVVVTSATIGDTDITVEELAKMGGDGSWLNWLNWEATAWVENQFQDLEQDLLEYAGRE
jgi:hypothetical protein